MALFKTGREKNLFWTLPQLNRGHRLFEHLQYNKDYCQVMLHFPHYYLSQCMQLKFYFKFGSKRTPLRGRLKIQPITRIYYVVTWYPSKDKGFFSPQKVPKAIPNNGFYFSTSGVFFGPQMQEALPLTHMWHTLDPGNEKSLCFK
jgi:hypothetical protein